MLLEVILAFEGSCEAARNEMIKAERAFAEPGLQIRPLVGLGRHCLKTTIFLQGSDLNEHLHG